MRLFKTLITVAALATSSVVSALNGTEIADIYWSFHRGRPWPDVFGGYTRKFVGLHIAAHGIGTTASVNTTVPKFLDELESFFRQARSDRVEILDSPMVTSGPEAAKITQHYRNRPLMAGTEYRVKILDQIRAIRAWREQTIADLGTKVKGFTGLQSYPILPYTEKAYNEALKLYSA
ncbi:hypothetical protein TWF281_010890 [Arthrobotrys megalospora]